MNTDVNVPAVPPENEYFEPMSPSEHLLPESPALPPDAEILAPPPPAPTAPPLAVIPRATFNYFVIAVVALLIGVVIGAVGFDRLTQQNREENAALIDQSVASAIAALPQGSSVDTEALINQAVATAVAAVPSGAQANDPNKRYDVAIADQPSMGPADAPVVMVEFGDFHCSYCKHFNDDTIKPLLDAYGDKVLFVYRDYPILGPNSLSAALAAGCANDQGAFWPFHDLMFANQTALNRDTFIQDATDLNLDVDTFTQCYDNQDHRSDVLQDYNDGQTLGVGGTPTFFINGKVFVGAQPYDSFAQTIDAELNADETPATS